jgi:transposase
MPREAAQMDDGKRGEIRPLVIGVDTHKDLHVAVAVDHLGVRLGQLLVPATTDGYAQLEQWARAFGTPTAFGIEGTGSYGAGLTRFLRHRDHRVIEVNRPDRATRHRVGKTDPLDAEAAARAVLAGVATAVPKSGDGTVELIRVLKVARDTAVRARSQALITLKIPRRDGTGGPPGGPRRVGGLPPPPAMRRVSPRSRHNPYGGHQARAPDTGGPVAGPAS